MYISVKFCALKIEENKKKVKQRKQENLRESEDALNQHCIHSIHTHKLVFYFK